MLLHDSAAVRLHGSLYSAAAAPRCGLVHVLWRWGGRDCCGVGVSKKYTFNLNTRKSIVVVGSFQGDSDGRGKQTASPMLTAIMSGGVGISGRELSTQLINSLEQANHSFS